MTTLITSADILDWVLFQAGEPTDGTSDYHSHTIALLNRAYRDIWMGGGALVKDMNEPWLWLKKDPPGVLILNPVVDDGTVAVTNNSASITFSTPPAASMANRFFKVDGHPDIFRVSAHTGGAASATLDSIYTGTTDGAAAFKCMQLEYDLASDVLRIIAPMRVYQDNKHEIDGVDLTSLERDYPLQLVQSGTPECFALVTETKVRFNRYGGTDSTALIRAEYDYLQKPTAELADDTTEPLIPKEHRQVLADVTLFYLLVVKSDSKAEGIGAQAKAALTAMSLDNQARRAQMSRSLGAIYPRPSNLVRFNRILRTETGLIIG